MISNTLFCCRMIPVGAAPGIAVVTACLLHACVAAGDPVTCTTCHAEQAEYFSGSVHKSLQCQECHHLDQTGEASSSAVVEFVDPSTGSKLVYDHGRSFSGSPSRSAVPELCGKCHADVERMNPYGLRTDQLARYWTSGHGKRLKNEGDERVAICVDCHGSHDILRGRDPSSRTYPLNVPDTCGTCHGDAALCEDYGLPVEVVAEYRESVHGKLLLEQEDTGAPTCATCHGNHSAMPPGFATVGAVCGQCHEHVAQRFAKSIHAEQEEHKGCVQCHGGGEGRHFHLIRRVTRSPGVLIQRYARLLVSEPEPTLEQVTEAIHPGPRQIIMQALPTCTECHEDLEDDESLPKLFELLDETAKAELTYVETANRLDQIEQGVLLVDNQRFKLEDAKTLLIELAPLQHELDNTLIAEKVTELNDICEQVNAELTQLEEGLRLRYRALIPIWIFAILFATALYVKFKQLKHAYVKPLPEDLL